MKLKKWSLKIRLSWIHFWTDSIQFMVAVISNWFYNTKLNKVASSLANACGHSWVMLWDIQYCIRLGIWLKWLFVISNWFYHRDAPPDYQHFIFYFFQSTWMMSLWLSIFPCECTPSLQSGSGFIHTYPTRFTLSWVTGVDVRQRQVKKGQGSHILWVCTTDGSVLRRKDDLHVDESVFRCSEAGLLVWRSNRGGPCHWTWSGTF